MCRDNIKNQYSQKVLFVASEMSPFIKTGGLGDVIGSLPFELRKKNIDARVVVPLYKNISFKNLNQSLKNLDHKLSFKARFCVFNDWRNKFAEAYFLDFLDYDIPVYFIKNDYYFSRDKVYGYDDDFERFAFFSKAVLDFLLYSDFKPDIINFNDWQTAMGCLYLKDFYQSQIDINNNSNKNFYFDIKSVFTIHNLQYQGVFSRNILNSILLDDRYFYFDKLEFYGDINFMKAGLLYSDMITTVSPTYAKEIQTMQYGYGLDGVLREKKNKLIGILNGFSYDRYYNFWPDKNSFLDIKNIRDIKTKNKKELCNNFNLKFCETMPVVGMLARFAEQKGLNILYESLEKILKLDLQLIIIGTGDAWFENLFLEAQKKFKNNFRVKIIFNEKLAKEIYLGSDIFLMPSKFEPCGLSQIISMRCGTIPVARKTGGLCDTIIDFLHDKENGTGFLFEEYNSNELTETLKQATNLYKNKSVWSKIIFNAVNQDFSWDKSADKYIELYKNLSESRSSYIKN